MRKIRSLLLITILTAGGLLHLWSIESFKFPSVINYELLKNDRIMGNCKFLYEKEGKFPGTSTLKLKGFAGLGLTSQEWLFTYIFTKDSSIYATFTIKGKKPLSEMRLKEGMGFDFKRQKVFIYKDLYSPHELQTEIFTLHPEIDLTALFFVTSQKVATGNHSKPQKFNFLFDKSTKIMGMTYIGTDKVSYQGKEVSTRVLLVKNMHNNKEIFRFKIFKDSNGYYFPVSVVVTDFTGSSQEHLELRATGIKK